MELGPQGVNGGSRSSDIPFLSSDASPLIASGFSVRQINSTAPKRDFSIDHLLYVDDEEASAPAPLSDYAIPNGDRSEF